MADPSPHKSATFIVAMLEILINIQNILAHTIFKNMMKHSGIERPSAQGGTPKE